MNLNVTEGEKLKYMDPYIVKLTNIACKINLVLMLIGVIGNILCIYGFSKIKMRIKKFNWYLLILSIFELLFCLILSIDYLFRVFNKLPKFLHDLNIYTNIIFDFLIHITDSFVILIKLILTIDRLYAIKNPIKIKEFVTNLHSRKLIVISIICLVFLEMPRVIVCHQEWENSYFNIYCTFIDPLIFNIIPILIILVLNTYLIFEIIFYYRSVSNKDAISCLVIKKTNFRPRQNYFQRKRRLNLMRPSSTIKIKKISRTQKSHYIVILFVALWAVLTSIPYHSINTYLLLFDFQSFESPTNVIKIGITQILLSIFFNSNHCFNFFIYLFFHYDFRYSFFKPSKLSFHSKISSLAKFPQSRS
jgi:hypothetical protein